MTTLLAIDPGGACGAVMLDAAMSPPTVLDIWPATSLSPLLGMIYHRLADEVVVEMVVSYGRPVGRDVMETLVKIGRIEEACRRARVKCHRISRPEVCIELCGSTRGISKGNVSQAVRDLYPATGGGSKPEVGIKKNPGPLYGVKSHAWDALALGVVWCGRRQDGN